jgi:hypothetical protein
MALLTPGLFFLSRAFASLLFLYTMIAVAQFILDDRFGILLPGWVLIVATVFLIPAIATVRLSWAQFYKRRRAIALGARVAPTISGSWPGNLDVLTEMVKNVRHGYPGKR